MSNLGGDCSKSFKYPLPQKSFPQMVSLLPAHLGFSSRTEAVACLKRGCPCPPPCFPKRVFSDPTSPFGNQGPAFSTCPSQCSFLPAFTITLNGEGADGSEPNEIEGRRRGRIVRATQCPWPPYEHIFIDYLLGSFAIMLRDSNCCHHLMNKDPRINKWLDQNHSPWWRGPALRHPRGLGSLANQLFTN